MKILIIGADGQDGQILTEIANESGHEVVGVTRNSLKLSASTFPLNRNLQNSREMSELLNEIAPEAIFNVAAVHASSSQMASLGMEKHQEMLETHVGLTENILNWQKYNLKTKSIIALSSQMYTSDKEVKIIDFTSPVNPSSVYGETKALAWNKIRRYRRNFGVRTSAAILFNHSSKYSRRDFLFIELAKQILDFMRGERDTIILRDANSRIDICDAFEVCQGMLRILNIETASDYIFSSGKLAVISDVITDCFVHLNIDKVPSIHSSAEPRSNFALIGDYSLTKKELGWEPIKSPGALLADIVVSLRGKGDRFA